MTALEVRDLDVARAGIAVVRGCSLRAEPGEVAVLLGANGAGKTTLLEAISGVLAASAGSVSLGDRELRGLSRHARARAGLAHVEQSRTVFPGLTVWENVRAGARDDDGASAALATFPELARSRDVPADRLSGGEQQMLVIVRALASRPRVLLVDEMSLGLAPKITRRLMRFVRELADRGLAVVLVEQFARLALEIGDRAYVLSRGSVCHEGDCRSLLANPELLHGAYLGAQV